MREAVTNAVDPATASALRWWIEAGADVLVNDAPRGWLKASGGESSGVTAPLPGRAAAVPLPGGERLQLPAALPDFLKWLRESPERVEARWGGTPILPSGDPQAPLMILVDAPEPDDADAGVLVSGEVGALFERMLSAIGQSRASIWLAPFATVRPIGGRIAAADLHRLTEIARHQIGLVAPKRLLVMGDRPAQALLGAPVMGARGRAHVLTLVASQVEAHATFHPRMLTERAEFKKEAWKDLQTLVRDL